MTLKDRILSTLRAHGPLDDSNLARMLRLRHQAVNRAARQLAATGQTTRIKRSGTLINAVKDVHDQFVLQQISASPTPSELVETERSPRVMRIALVGCVT